jgi:putative DNA primase/helicase
MQAAKETIRDLYHQASLIDDVDRRDRLVKHARRSERLERLRAMVKLAETEPGIPVTPAQLDADPWLLNVLNGTIDLRTGELRPHNKADLITKVAPIEYDPGARSSVWTDFLDRITRGDAELQAFLQRLAGASLAGVAPDEIFVLLVGGTATGKSTFLEATKAAMGEYAVTADVDTFLRRIQDGPRNDIARLVGARLVTCSEAPPGRALDERLVKQLTGGDKMSARFLYREFFEFLPQFTPWMATNHRPTVRDDDDAIWRRLIEVPFTVEIPEDERDPAVKAFLRNPSKGGPAVLAWTVDGCVAWQREGLRRPQCVREATAAYRGEMSAVSDFLEECCELAADSWTAAKAITQAHQGWSWEQGYRYPLGPQRLAQALRSRGLTPRKRSGVRGWDGIRLVDRRRGQKAG